MSSLKVLSIGQAQMYAYLNKSLNTVETHMGGTAVNTAKNYKALGHPSKARIWLGFDSAGKQIEEHLTSQGITTVSTITKGEKTPHTLFLETKQNTLVSLIEQEDALHEILHYEDIKMIDSANWIHLSSLNCSPSSLNKIFGWVYKEKAIPLTWTPGPAQIKAGFHAFHEILEHTVVLGLNKEELLKFTGRRNIEYAIKDLQHAGVKLLVITNADHVIQVIGYNERFTIMPPHGKIRDHVGAGDRWLSTFTSYAATEYDIVEAMQMATFHTHLLMKEKGPDTSLLSKTELEKKFQREKKQYLVHVHDYR